MAAVAVSAMVAAATLSGAGTAGTQTAPTVAVPTTTPTTAGGAGRIAYVTPGGDVVVANGDGTGALTVGSDAAVNRWGLAPLAWRQPAADAITYVRKDGALVVAPVTGEEPQIVATDAVVPADADEDIISWQLSGAFLAYVAQPAPGVIESRVIDFSRADEDSPPEVRILGNPDGRDVLAQGFSPVDPVLWQRTADPETGREFTLAIVEPFEGKLLPTPLTVFDPTMSPDGRYLYAVLKGTGDIEQIVRISISGLEVDVLVDLPRICRPSVSPAADKVVFGAGENCEQVWIMDANGADPRPLTERVSGTATFAVGSFSWSLDGRTISHASCKVIGDEPYCTGGYLDISSDGLSVRPRAEAGAVRRESRALLRPVKVTVRVDGGIDYEGEMSIGTESFGDLSEVARGQEVTATGFDDEDATRSVTVEMYHPSNEVWLTGRLRIQDGDVDETMVFYGRALPASYGFAKVRGVWTQTSTLPMRSGQVVITFER